MHVWSCCMCWTCPVMHILLCEEFWLAALMAIESWGCSSLLKTDFYLACFRPTFSSAQSPCSYRGKLWPLVKYIFKVWLVSLEISYNSYWVWLFLWIMYFIEMFLISNFCLQTQKSHFNFFFEEHGSQKFVEFNKLNKLEEKPEKEFNLMCNGWNAREDQPCGVNGFLMLNFLVIILSMF